MTETLVSLAWGPWTLGLFFGVGLFFSIRSGWFQLFGLPRWLRETVGRLRPGRTAAGLSPLQTLSTALAATIGTGSIAGVATALSFGGPGALVWMWLGAALSMMTGCAEKTLSIAVRCRRPDGSYEGGPIYWLRRKGHPMLAGWFALCTVLSSLGMGNAVQANSLSDAMEFAFGWPPLLTGLAVTVLVGITLVGGIRRIGQVCERLVPAMAVLFLLLSAAALWRLRAALPGALATLVRESFSLHALLGGGMGNAVRQGLARGICTNEAGLGSTPMVHCQSANTDPVQEGMWGILEVALATFLVCSLTALVLLASGVPESSALSGAAWTAACYQAALGPVGPVVLALCLALFSGSSLVGWSWYGLTAAHALWGKRGERLYRVFFLLLIPLGILALGGVGYGGYKRYKHYQNKKRGYE